MCWCACSAVSSTAGIDEYAAGDGGAEDAGGADADTDVNATAAGAEDRRRLLGRRDGRRLLQDSTDPGASNGGGTGNETAAGDDADDTGGGGDTGGGDDGGAENQDSVYIKCNPGYVVSQGTCLRDGTCANFLKLECGNGAGDGEACQWQTPPMKQCFQKNICRNYLEWEGSTVTLRHV